AMVLHSIRNWLRPLTRSRKRSPLRNRRRHVPTLEALETRITPVMHVNAGGLRFEVESGGEFLTDDGGKTYTALKATGSIGYVPPGTENFVSLIQSRPVEADIRWFKVDTSAGDPTFEILNADLWLVLKQAKAHGREDRPRLCYTWRTISVLLATKQALAVRLC